MSRVKIAVVGLSLTALFVLLPRPADAQCAAAPCSWTIADLGNAGTMSSYDSRNGLGALTVLP